jgi:hypothetical protein
LIISSVVTAKERINFRHLLNNKSLFFCRLLFFVYVCISLSIEQPIYLFEVNRITTEASLLRIIEY